VQTAANKKKGKEKKARRFTVVFLQRLQLTDFMLAPEEL
jgi:hypothetical protein